MTTENKQAKFKTEVSNLVSTTAKRTIAILAVFLVFVMALYLLISPLSAGNFFYSLGFRSFSANLTLSGAEKSGEFDDYYDAFIRAVAGKNHAVVVAAGDKMLKDSDFTDKIGKHDLSSDDYESTYGAGTYVKYNFIYSKTIRQKGYTEELYDRAAGYNRLYGSTYYYRSYNALSAMVKALADNPKLELGDILDKLEEIYYADSKEWNLNYRPEKTSGYENLCLDVMNLIDSRGITGDVRTRWVVYSNSKGLNLE